MRPALLLAPLALAACGSSPLGQEPPFTPISTSVETLAMATPSPFAPILPFEAPRQAARASLWDEGGGALVGDDRASERGDLLTVVINIDDSAEFRNQSERGRQGSEAMGIDALFGLPEALAPVLTGEASLSPAVGLNSRSSFEGEGSIRRSEEMTLRVAATVTDVLPNGVLAIAGSQEVRVNNELRELLVTGFVRPADVSRLNEVDYDRIAQARISYGGRGQVTDMQQPRAGQQAVGLLLPF